MKTLVGLAVSSLFTLVTPTSSLAQVFPSSNCLTTVTTLSEESSVTCTDIEVTRDMSSTNFHFYYSDGTLLTFVSPDHVNSDEVQEFSVVGLLLRDLNNGSVLVENNSLAAKNFCIWNATDDVIKCSATIDSGDDFTIFTTIGGY